MSASNEGGDANKNANANGQQPPGGAGGGLANYLPGGAMSLEAGTANPMNMMSAMLGMPPSLSGGVGMPPGASMMGGPLMMGPVPPGMMDAMMDAMAMGGGPYGGGAMGAMPPWMTGGGAMGDGPAASAAGGAGGKLQKKGKKAKKDGAASQQGPAAKRKKRASSAAEASTDEEPEVHIELMTDAWQREVLDKFQRCASAEGIKDTSFFHTTTKGQAMVSQASAGGGSSRYRRYGASSGGSGVGNINCLRKLLAELNRMEYEDNEQLPGGTAPIWLRYDDETPQYMRAIITGPPRDTPYSNGLFTFDIYVPDSYPNTPPRVQLLTTGGGTVGFSPNLYSDGKVCLSLLNTWSGPKWDPGNSSILQILVSIQGLILGVEHPYYMEPGYGGWEASHSSKAAKKAAIMNGGADLGSPPPAGTTVKPATAKLLAKVQENKGGKGTAAGAASATAAAGVTAGATSATANPQNGSSGSNLHSYIPLNVRRYEDNIRMGTIKYAVGEYCREIIKKSQSSTAANARPNYLSAFQDIVHAHFWHRKECVLADGKKWVNTACSSSQKRLMQSALTSLEKVLEQLVAPPSTSATAGEDPMDVSGSAKASAVAGEDPENAAKRKQMEAAAAKGDYITAGRIQAELEVSAKVHDMIVARRKEMDDAAEKKDYVQAGKMQLIVQHLEKNRRRLQDLERRMFESAAKQDFVKAGKFQEQYRILLEDVGEGVSKSSAGAGAGASGKISSVGASLGGAIASSLLGVVGGGGAQHIPIAPPPPMGPPPGPSYGAYDNYYDLPTDQGDYADY